jgi:hypothetical protein
MEIILKKAKEAGIVVTDKEVDAYLANLANLAK